MGSKKARLDTDRKAKPKAKITGKAGDCIGLASIPKEYPEIPDPPKGPSIDYLLGEISVDGPEYREDAVAFNLSLKDSSKHKMLWPEGWWAVSDDQFGYLAFFQFEADAWAYRLYLINLRMNAPHAHARYAKVDGDYNSRDHEPG